MSIYVKLMEKDTVKSETSTDYNNSKKVSGSKNCSSIKNKDSSSSSIQALDFNTNILDELPNIDSTWNGILAGDVSYEQDSKPSLDGLDTEEAKSKIPAADLKFSEETRHIFSNGVGQNQSGRSFVKNDSKTVAVENDKNKQDQIVQQHVQIPMRKFRVKGMVTPDMEHKGIVEEFRHIKRILSSNIKKKNGSMGVGVAVTSALPGEGKTFTSLNLVMSLSSDKTKNILLVDSDLEKGSATEFLGLSSNRGLKDYLEDSSLELDDVVLNTDIKNLQIIPRGIAESHSAEVYSTERMEILIAKLCNSSEFDMVIFDAPPALVSSSANILAGLVDQTLAVVQANETSGSHIRELEETLVDSRMLGYVLNRAPYSEKKHNIYYSQNT